MAHPVSADPQAEHAERVLFTTIVQDASLARGDLPLDRAVARHLATAAEGYGDLLGPLVVPFDRLGDLAALNRGHPLSVVVDATGAAGPEEVRAGLDRLAGDRSLTVAGVDISWWECWHIAAGWAEAVSVLVPFDHNLRAALEDVAEHTGAASALQAVVALEGIGVGDLATVIRHGIDLDLGYKLTGGTPGAVTVSSAASATSAADVGFLNVVAASRYALAHASEVPELVDLLGQPDPDATAAILTRMSEADGSVVRAFFTSYATTDVTASLDEVAELGLLQPV